MDKQIRGYTVGSYDMFHIGHLNILRKAKEQCDYLVVGVNSDETIIRCKDKAPIIPYTERVKIIEAIKYVDEVIKVECAGPGQKADDWPLRLSSDVVVTASDAKNAVEWQELDRLKRETGGKVLFFPYTKTTSSTTLREALHDRIN